MEHPLDIKTMTSSLYYLIHKKVWKVNMIILFLYKKIKEFYRSSAMYPMFNQLQWQAGITDQDYMVLILVLFSMCHFTACRAVLGISSIPVTITVVRGPLWGVRGLTYTKLSQTRPGVWGYIRCMDVTPSSSDGERNSSRVAWAQMQKSWPGKGRHQTLRAGPVPGLTSGRRKWAWIRETAWQFWKEFMWMMASGHRRFLEVQQPASHYLCPCRNLLWALCWFAGFSTLKSASTSMKTAGQDD